MNIRAYIESGILEQYVLGLTSPVETAEVEKLAQQHSEVQTEIEEIRSSLELYAQQFAQTPPVALKDRIWDALTEADATASRVASAAENDPANSVRTYTSLVWSTYGIAASFVLLAVSVLGNLYLFNQLQKTENQLLQATNQNTTLAQQLEVNQANYQNAATALAYYQNPSNKVIHLANEQMGAKAGIVVFWDQKKQQVFLTVRNMPTPPKGKQYQLWAIVNQKPVDAGVFTTQTDAVQAMKSIPQAQAFAVTLEKTGGNPVPTNDILMIEQV